MSTRPTFRSSLRIGAVTAALALTPLAFTAGGDLRQNDACAAKEAGVTCCRELMSVCTLDGQTHIDRYLANGKCPEV
jgi:hypothetical protein